MYFHGIYILMAGNTSSLCNMSHKETVKQGLCREGDVLDRRSEASLVRDEKAERVWSVAESENIALGKLGRHWKISFEENVAIRRQGGSDGC